MQRTEELRRDCLSAAVLLAIAGGYLWVAQGYSLDTLANPGPGVFPRFVGLALGGLTALQVMRTGWRLRRVLRERPAAPAAPGDQDGRAVPSHRVPSRMVGILVLYSVAMARVGFLTSTFALTIACSQLMGMRSWARSVALAAGLVVACYVLFSVWLKVPLPAGLLR